MNILYLNDDFFEYDKAIIMQLRRMGHEVISYKYRRLPHFWEIYWCQIKKIDVFEYVNKQVQKVLLQTLKKSEQDIDLILVTSGQELLKSTLKSLKLLYPASKMVWYLWDNCVNIPNFEEQKKCYDIIVSFDKMEAEEKGFYFLPDFYICDFTTEEVTKEYDLCYVGTYNEYRYNLTKKISAMLYPRKCFIYLYKQKDKGIRAMMKRLFVKEVRENIYEKKMEYSELVELFKKSRCILDIAAPKQTGLSMRPYESLALRRKLLTTNSTVKDYDFYNEKNIFILNTDNLQLPPGIFWNEKYVEMPDEIIKKYSVSNWCSCLETIITELKGE